MTETEPNASEVIQAYRKRRERMIPMILAALAIVLLVVGIFLVVIWLTGGNPPQLPSFRATATYTPTQTSTPVPPTATPTMTNTPAPTETPTPPEPQIYTVEVGDTLGAIAEKFEVDVLLLMAYNPQILDAGIINVGDKITIPPPGAEMPTPTALPSTLIAGQEIVYMVLPDDTLASIALKFNSTADAIAKRNDIDNPNLIYVGMRLVIPVGLVTPEPTSTPSAGTPTPTATSVE